jgi:hypothetical protein
MQRHFRLPHRFHSMTMVPGKGSILGNNRHSLTFGSAARALVLVSAIAFTLEFTDRTDKTPSEGGRQRVWSVLSVKLEA